MERPQRHEPERFYVPTDTSGTLEGCRIGVAWLMGRGRTWVGDPLVVVPTVRSARSNQYLRTATKRYHWETTHTHQGARARGWQGGATLLVFPDAGVLRWFDQSPQVPALCVIQGRAYDTTAWAKAHRPVDLTTGRPFAEGPYIDPVVEQALASIPRSVHWHKLTSAEDISLVVRTLRLLRDHGYPFSPQDLEAWALVESWEPSVSGRLADYAAKVLDGRQIVLRAETAPARGAIARWRKAAEAGPPGRRASGAGMHFYQRAPRRDYEDVLRALGALLDEHHLEGALVVETHRGFLAMGSRRMTPEDATGAGGSPPHYEYAEARFVDASLKWASERGYARRGSGRRAGRYEQAFRLIGHRVNEAKGSLVLLLDQDDGFLLRTLSTATADMPYRMATLCTAELDLIREESVRARGSTPSKARRHKPKAGRASPRQPIGS